MIQIRQLREISNPSRDAPNSVVFYTDESVFLELTPDFTDSEQNRLHELIYTGTLWRGMSGLFVDLHGFSTCE